MNSEADHEIFQQFSRITLHLGFVLLVAGCGNVDITWREDVLLEDGRMLLVKRTAKGKRLGEIGGPGGWEATEMTLEIEEPSSSANPPRWGERWVPMVFDYDSKTKEWYVVATFYMCEDWYDLGRPKLPYVEYRARGGKWERVPLNSGLFGKKANLLTAVRSGGEKRRVTIEDKTRRDWNAGRKFKEVSSTWYTSC